MRFLIDPKLCILILNYSVLDIEENGKCGLLFNHACVWGSMACQLLHHKLLISLSISAPGNNILTVLPNSFAFASVPFYNQTLDSTEETLSNIVLPHMLFGINAVLPLFVLLAMLQCMVFQFVHSALLWYCILWKKNFTQKITNENLITET